MELNEKSAIIEITCMEVRRLNADYLDGNLGLDEYIRVDAHLEHCGHCSAIYDGIRNVVTLLASDEFFQVPDGLDERLCDALMGLGDTQAN
jgi:predicted anti-sigma-YlaC factor YlaD